MPTFRIGGKSVLFVHVPKTGGTTIEEVLAVEGEMRLFRTLEEELPCPPQHFHAALLDLLFRPEDFDYAFLIVRNPVERLFSEYRYRGTLHTFMPGFSEWLAAAFERFRDDPYHMQNHLRPQKEFLGLGAELFRLEEGLLPVFDRLGGVLGRDYAGAERTYHRESGRRHVHYRASDLDRIASFYAEDFETFGYALPGAIRDASLVPERAFFDLFRGRWLWRRGRARGGEQG